MNVTIEFERVGSSNGPTKVRRGIRACIDETGITFSIEPALRVNERIVIRCDDTEGSHFIALARILSVSRGTVRAIWHLCDDDVRQLTQMLEQDKKRQEEVA